MASTWPEIMDEEPSFWRIVHTKLDEISSLVEAIHTYAHPVLDVRDLVGYLESAQEDLDRALITVYQRYKECASEMEYFEEEELEEG